MPSQRHHFAVSVTSYPSKAVQAKAEAGWYPGLLLELKQRTVYHGYSRAKATSAFYRAIRAAHRHPLTLYVSVMRDSQLYLRARPESW